MRAEDLLARHGVVDKRGNIRKGTQLIFATQPNGDLSLEGALDSPLPATFPGSQQYSLLCYDRHSWQSTFCSQCWACQDWHAD